MGALLHNLRNRWYTISIIVIIVLATLLRFYNYENRWGLAYDQAHDAVVARYAVHEGKIPLLGPFSSAGPFQTGGEWYWLLMIPTAIYPYSVYSPWVFITFLYVVFVYTIIRVGYSLEGKFFSIIVGLLATVSTAQIAQGVNLTNQSPHAINGLLAIYCMVYYIKTKKVRFLFIQALLISFSASIHLQGVGLIMLFITTVLIGGIPSFKYIPFIITGFILPLFPAIILTPILYPLEEIKFLASRNSTKARLLSLCTYS